MRKPKRRNGRGTSRMIALGKKSCQIWLTAQEHALLMDVSRQDHRPMATYVKLAALQAAARQSGLDRAEEVV